MHRHKNIKWSDVESKLNLNAEKIKSLNAMESTGGEPDIVDFDKKTGAHIFYDCSSESPKGRRSLCYDRKALDSRKEFKPKNNVVDLCESMGIDLLDEDQYKMLQEIEAVDLKTSSWIKTPDEIRTLGGAIFCDRRYDHVFTYHNGAESYYASRGFRGLLRV
jgi:hypothetical protein